jgi:hypothetical protein
MTLREGISKLVECVGSNFHKIGEAVMGANLTSLIKVGAIAGASIAAIALVIKFIRDKKKMYKDESNKTVVDKSLDLNYRDARNRDKLHPLMKSVRKNLEKDLKPRKSSGKKRRVKKDVIERYSKKANKRNRRRPKLMDPEDYTFEESNPYRRRDENGNLIWVFPWEHPEDYDEEADTAAANARIQHLVDNWPLYFEQYETPDDGMTLKRVWKDGGTVIY